MTTIYILITSGVFLQIIDYFYHWGRSKKIRTIRNINSIKEAHLLFKKIGIGPQKWDNIIGIFPFVWTWLYITVSVLLALYFNNPVLHAATSLFIATRMRALQEIGHFAMHGSLVKNKNTGIILTNIFCQYPLLLTSSSQRQINHCIKHHPNAGIPRKDPNIDEFIFIGFTPLISMSKFIVCIFYPLSPNGIIGKFVKVAKNYKDFSMLRFFITLLLIFPFLWYGYFIELIVLYFIPVILIYPQFAWISQIVEHRWFIKEDKGIDRYTRELTIGRPTFYKGIIGQFIKFCLFPFGDSYHLAHSLFQYARYNYLGAINEVMSKSPEYMKYASHGLIFKQKKNMHSAFSELRERITY